MGEATFFIVGILVLGVLAFLGYAAWAYLNPGTTAADRLADLKNSEEPEQFEVFAQEEPSKISELTERIGALAGPSSDEEKEQLKVR
ncbi:MAG: hypothetical protein HN348_07710, partial [Proteobacteria bacterium]|nr:hypothetical protein [Pseudomonadota bacterium]